MCTTTETSYASPAAGSRRRRLWEIDTSHHCLLIGTCFDIAELRTLIGKRVRMPGSISDYELHRCTVQACAQRSAVSETLHKALDRRHALVLRQYRGHDTAALARAWRQAVAEGRPAPALWAILSHPRCSEALAAEVYGELHMLQHQTGSLQRRELAAFQTLQREHAALLRELARVQARATQERDQRSMEIQRLNQTMASLSAERIGWQEQANAARRELDDLRARLPELADRERLLRRMHCAEAQCEALRAHAAAQEEALAQWQNRCRQLETVQTAAQQPGCAHTAQCDTAEACSLAGKQVLCIGGRPGIISFYRQLVENHGGAFQHHDGGMEENIAMLEPSIAAADAVICQAGCISHNAYWRVKDFCKRNGKPCVFVKNTGLSSFQRGLQQLLTAQPG